MSDFVTHSPPQESEFVWIRADRVQGLLLEVLNEVVEARGNTAKAFAWDVRVGFARKVEA